MTAHGAALGSLPKIVYGDPTALRGKKMLIVNLLMNEKLLDAEIALGSVRDPERVVGLCREYLELLREYRHELAKLEGDRIGPPRFSSSLARELTEQVRRAIRNALDAAASERDNTWRLLRSLTQVSAYQAMVTFNSLSYLGLSNWELREEGMRAADRILTIGESVTAASELRCIAYASTKRVFY